MSSEDISKVPVGESNIHQAPSFHKNEPAENTTQHPPLNYSSPSQFITSLRAKLKSIFTKRFIFALAAGQLVSICISGTSVATTELVKRDWALPTTQSIFVYFSLFIVYTPYTIYQCKLSSHSLPLCHRL